MRNGRDHPHRGHLLLGVVLCFVCAMLRAEPPVGGGTRTVLAGQIELARLVDLAATRLGLNIEYDASVLRGSVTLRLEAGLSDDELWALTNRVLAARGFTTIRLPGDGPISIVKLSDAQALSRLGPTDGPATGYTTVVLRIEHRPADEIAEVIRPLLSRVGGNVSVLGQSGLIMVSDLAPRVEQAAALIEQLDVPSEEAVVEEVPLRFLSPVQLTALAEQVESRRELVTGREVPGQLMATPDGKAVMVIAPRSALAHWRELIERLDKREPVRMTSYSPRHFGLAEVASLIEQTVRDPQRADDRWRVVQDELTGSLIVTATASQHERIAALMARLDELPPAARRSVRSFPIRNRTVLEVVDLLNNLLDAGVLEAGGFEPRMEQREQATLLPDSRPKAADNARQPSADKASDAAGPGPSRGMGVSGFEGLTLTADEGTNTLIAVGEPRVLNRLGPLIEQLDVRQPQVMLEVMIVSLSEGQSHDLGVELEKIEINGSTTVRLSSLFGLSSASGSSASRSVGDGVGFTGSVLSPGDFSVVIRALETVSDGRSLSMPRLLVNNNQQAVFDSVLQEPFAAVNASDTIATTSFGGTQDAGTSVTIRPQIAEGDHVVLEYSVRLSSFVGESSSPELPPARQQNSVQSVVTIPDGYTVVVGGLEALSDGDSESRVPLVGRLPLIGEAFKNRSRSSSRTRFYVFIRANVLRDRGFKDLKYLSARDTRAAGIDDGWPEVEPRIIR
jgi:type II secretory pathway component GspD/PulD (secretin)